MSVLPTNRYAIDRLARHDLFALRSSVHVAMRADEIAKFAHINLKDFSFRAAQGSA